MSEQVAAIAFRLDAQTAKFESAMKRAERQFQTSAKKMEGQAQRLDTKMKATGAEFAAGFSKLLPAIGVGVVARALDGMISKLDAIGKTADRIGFTTDALQELRSAAEQSGVSTGALDVALQRFSRRVAEARQGTGEAVKALAEMGVALTNADGSARSNEAVLNDVADAMQRTGSESDRLRLAVKLFDTEGAGLAVTLRDGAEGLDAMRARAREMGAVIEEDSVRAAEALRTEIDLLTEAAGSTFVAAAGRFAQALNKIFNIGGRGDVSKARDMVAAARREIDGLTALSRPGAVGLMRHALDPGTGDQLATRLDEARLRLGAAQARLDFLTAPDIETPAGPVTRTETGGTGRAGRAASASDEFGRLTDSIIDANLRREDELRLIGLGETARVREAAAIARARLENDLFSAAIKDGKPITDALRETVDAYGQATEDLTLKLHAAEAAERAKANASEAAARAADEAKRNIETVGNALMQGVLQANSFADALKNVAIQLANFAVQGAFGAGPLAGIGTALFGPTGTSTGALKLNAKGNVFSGGNVVPFKNGGVVSKPTMFLMPSGAGLMGEAGPEAIMPLKRGPGGRLGVEGAAPVVNVVVNSSEKFGVTQRTGPDGRTLQIVIDQVVAQNVGDPGSATGRALALRGQRTVR